LAHVTQRKLDTLNKRVGSDDNFDTDVEVTCAKLTLGCLRFYFFWPLAQTSEVWFSAIWSEPIFREGMTTLTSPEIASLPTRLFNVSILR